MPRFTLTKHAETEYDSNVTVTFTAEMVDVAKAHFEDFLRASGFEFPIDDEPDFERRLTVDDWLAKAEDLMWDDAFESKFRNDGPVGAEGADVLPFPSDK